MSDWDAIVVGAGPGGATAARGLARNGLRVLLLEKEKIPRYKPCGGGLTAKVKNILDVDFAPTVQDTITQVSIAYGAERMRAQPVTAWCVMRDQFDAMLTEYATCAGATFRDASPVSSVVFDENGAEVTTRGEKLRAQFVVGADGVNGIVRKAAGVGPHKNFSVALEAEMDAPSAAIEEWRGALHMDYSALPWGYAWIFPKAEHLSVGIGTILHTVRGLNIRDALAHYIASEPSLKDARTRFTRGHRIPISRGFGTYHTSRALLVGDAAGVVDPFTGEGIYYAIRSGQIAAEEIAQAWNDGGNLSRYTERINAEINSDFRTAVWFAEIFYRVPRFSYWVFSISPSTRQAAVGIVSAAGGYRTTLWWLAKRAVRRLARGRRVDSTANAGSL